MVDNEKYDDEYQFVDPEGGVDALDYVAETETPAASEPSMFDKTFAGKSVLIRNALVVIVLLIVVMVIFPLVRTLLLGKSKPVEMVAAPMKPAPISVPVSPPPSISTQASAQLNEQMSRKLATLESNQERMQTEVSTTNTQLGEINTNINEMMSKVSELNRVITLYSTKVDEQSREIAQLTAEAAALKKAKMKRVVKHKSIVPPLKYYIQAVIPGRAWLLVSNGSTLTVREGTVIAGLGTVKLIDPRQGRVILSSGRVIRFSQEDS